MAAVLAHWARRGLALGLALGLGVADVAAATPTNSRASSTEIAEAKKVLEANGYADIAVLARDGRMVTASAVKDGQKSVLDVDPMTGIIPPHADMPPIPSDLAPVTGMRANPR
jgi:hypothetical protein